MVVLPGFYDSGASLKGFGALGFKPQKHFLLYACTLNLVGFNSAQWQHCSSGLPIELHVVALQGRRFRRLVFLRQGRLFEGPYKGPFLSSLGL